MINTDRQPPGELCHCPESLHPHRHLHMFGAARVVDDFRQRTPEEAKDWLLDQIFGDHRP